MVSQMVVREYQEYQIINSFKGVTFTIWLVRKVAELEQLEQLGLVLAPMAEEQLQGEQVVVVDHKLGLPGQVELEQEPAQQRQVERGQHG